LIFYLKNDFLIYEIKMENLSVFKKETSCVGKKWTSQEETQLLNSVTINKNSFEEIAKEHKRKVGGIKSRLKKIVLNMIEKDGKTVEETAKLLNLTVEEIKKKETEIDVLKDIQDILIRLENKFS